MLFNGKMIELIHKKAAELVKQHEFDVAQLTPIIYAMRNDTTLNPFTYVTNISPVFNQYTIIGVDGSQIYPDRHNAISCFLLHIGTILIEYGNINGTVKKEGHPLLFSSWNTFQDTVHTHDIVDTERFLHELHYGLLVAKEYKKTSDNPILVFIDGPLLFWHLRQKPVSFVSLFSEQYQTILNEYKKYQIPLVGYTSKPGSKELISYIKQYAFQQKILLPELQQLLSSITDTTLLSLFLTQHNQTDLFLSQTKFGTLQTEEIYFYYYNLGSEYARIELPAWVVDDTRIRSFVFGAVKQQIQNGFGYPTVLGLAHEISVIKNEDRILFFKLLHKALQKQGIIKQFSQKQSKKEACSIM